MFRLRSQAVAGSHDKPLTPIHSTNFIIKNRIIQKQRRDRTQSRNAAAKEDHNGERERLFQV